MANSAIQNAISRVLTEEATALLALRERLDDSFSQAVELILACKGRIATCGIGKSGHIAEKAAATLASTGTPSFFLHAAEAVHGDLGMITEGDVVLVYTYSGETDEVVRLFPSFRSIGATTILLCGRTQSSAALLADLVLDVRVDSEACPNNLAPTTSTTLMLALSDALAIAVMEQRGFSAEEFARFHPAGALGKRLTLMVRDVMRQGEDLPIVTEDVSVLDLMARITRAGAGGACVASENGLLVGYVSDGDLRRWFMSQPDPLAGRAGEIMTKGVATIEASLTAFEALEYFQNHPRKIGELPVVEQGVVVGLLMVKDLLRAGLV